MKRLPSLSLLALFALAQAQETALDRYIARPDPAYGWKLVNTLHDRGRRADVLELTSQRWRTEADVDRPVWKHWLTIAIWTRLGRRSRSAPV
jgi:hypothetical protein